MPFSGIKITVSDMSALAYYANGRGLLNTEVNQNWNGFYPFSSLWLNYGGSGYKIDDILGTSSGDGTTSNSDSYVVTAVDLSGSILGIKVLAAGYTPYGYYDPTYPFTSPVALGGGSGTGALLNVTLGFQINSNTAQAFEFGDINTNTASIQGLQVVQGGKGYYNSQSVYVTTPDFLITASVSVDGNGSITTASIVAWGDGVPRGWFTQIPIYNPCNRMPVTSSISGSGAMLGATMLQYQKSAWLTELNRMRNNINVGWSGPIDNFDDYWISQKWPLNFNTRYIIGPGPFAGAYGSTYGYSEPNGISADNVSFYYPSISGSVTMELMSRGEIQSVYQSTPYPPTSSLVQYISSNVLAGGTLNGTFHGYFYYLCNPLETGSATFSATTNFPGISFPSVTKNANSGATGPFILSSSVVTASLTAGSIYNFTATATGSGSFDGGITYSGIACEYFTTVATPVTNVPGICATSTTDRLDAFLSGSSDAQMFGLYNWHPTVYYTQPAGTGGTAYFNWSWKHWGGNAYQPLSSSGASIGGVWAGNTAAIASCNPVPAGAYPWNMNRTKNSGSGHGQTFQENPMLLQGAGAAGPSNSYNNRLSVEQQIEYPSWQANTPFTLYFTIMDGNGNIQQCVQPGVSGGSTPNWGTGITIDGGIGGRGGVIWDCIKILNPNLNTWLSGHYYNLGTNVTDPQGNVYTNVPLFTGQASGGYSGVTAPNWGASSGMQYNGNAVMSGSLTGDPLLTAAQVVTLSMITGSGISYPPLWECTGYRQSSSVFVPTPHCQGGFTPSYPVCWLNETNAYLLPPTTNHESEVTVFGTGNQWQLNGYFNPIPPYNPAVLYDPGWQASSTMWGCWIYQIIVNRLGTSISGSSVLVPQSGSVNCTIGAKINGSYTSFGSFTSGQGPTSVLWPIFSGDVLWYDCSERLDIQVMAIGYNPPNGGVSVGSIIPDGTPMLAAHINDTYTLLSYL